MITRFNSKSIYIGTDMKRFYEIREYLESNSIKYKYKVKNHLGKWNVRGTIRGTMGSIGNSSVQMYEYEIMIHKKDADKIRL